MSTPSFETPGFVELLGTGASPDDPKGANEILPVYMYEMIDFQLRAQKLDHKDTPKMSA